MEAGLPERGMYQRINLTPVVTPQYFSSPILQIDFI